MVCDGYNKKKITYDELWKKYRYSITPKNIIIMYPIGKRKI